MTPIRKTGVAALMLSLFMRYGTLAVATGQPAASQQRRPPAPVSVVVPDTMKVSAQGAVPATARVKEALTVKLAGGKMLADSSPWCATSKKRGRPT